MPLTPLRNYYNLQNFTYNDYILVTNSGSDLSDILRSTGDYVYSKAGLLYSKQRQKNKNPTRPTPFLQDPLRLMHPPPLY